MVDIKSDLWRLFELADFYDLSFSVTSDSIERRALLGWKLDHARLDILSRVFCDWGIPAKLVEQWAQNANTAELVGIAVDQDVSSFRLYTHKWLGVSLQDIGTPVYWGYKFLPGAVLRVDEYINHGDMRLHGNLQHAISLSPQPKWLERLVMSAPAQAPLLFTRTENAGRRSWLVTARYAELDAGSVVGPGLNGRKLLHLAGGIDAVKGSFATVYVAAGRSEIENFIHGHDLGLELECLRSNL